MAIAAGWGGGPQQSHHERAGFSKAIRWVVAGAVQQSHSVGGGRGSAKPLCSRHCPSCSLRLDRLVTRSWISFAPPTAALPTHQEWRVPRVWEQQGAVTAAARDMVAAHRRSRKQRGLKRGTSISVLQVMWGVGCGVWGVGGEEAGWAAWREAGGLRAVPRQWLFSTTKNIRGEAISSPQETSCMQPPIRDVVHAARRQSSPLRCPRAAEAQRQQHRRRQRVETPRRSQPFAAVTPPLAVQAMCVHRALARAALALTQWLAQLV
eukprot:364730-Chlamydomonas_euryale.AAC.12